MPQRNVASNFTFEQQRGEINNLAQDYWTFQGSQTTLNSTWLKLDGSNAFTGGTLAVPNAFTINSNSGNGTVTISGNLNVSGTTTTVSSANLEVTDKNILIAKGSTSDANSDGAGITIDSDTDITFNFVDAKDALVSSIGLEATTTLVAGGLASLQGARFAGTQTPSAGVGVEITQPDANTGNIQAYDRTNSAFKDLRLKGASVGFYAGSTNALVGAFHNTGLTMESGKTITGDLTGTASKVNLTSESSSTTAFRVPFTSANSGSVDLYADNSDGITYKPSDGRLSVQKLEGTIVTAAQGNITSVGTLTGLTVDAGANGTIDFGDTNSGTVAFGRLYADNTGTFIGSKSNHDLILRTNNVETTRIDVDGKLVHKCNKASGYIAEFHQEHADNPGTILIDGPSDGNIRPTAIELAQAGSVKWGIGQVYASTASQAFHICSGAATEANAKLTIRTDGNVGIGDNNPSALLSLKGSSPTIRFTNGSTLVGSIEGGSNNTYYGFNGADIIFSTHSATSYVPRLTVKAGGPVLIGTTTSNTSDTFTIIDPGNAFISLRSDAQADGNSQVIDFAVGTSNRSSGNLVSTITSAIPTGATAGGTLKGYLAFSSNAGDNLAERVRINEYGNLVVGVNPTTSSSGSGKHNVPLVVHGPDKNAVTLMLGNSSNSVTSLGVNDYSGDIRFNGADVAWGDISYYPNGDGANGSFRFTRNGSTVATNGNASIGCGGINTQGSIKPINDNSYDLGASGNRWANIYSADLQLSNEGSTNEVDGTWGNYTIQEGESDLFLINRRNGKKYKFNLTEVS